MRRIPFVLIATFVALTFFTYRQTHAKQVVDRVISSADLQSWYLNESGISPNLNTFGIFDVQPVGDTLFFGVGTGAPSELDGALLASITGETLTNLGSLDEQGVDELIWFNDQLHVAGVDPCCGDDWSTGNHYTFDEHNGLIKHRNALDGLPNVLHTWGFETVEDHLYAATSGTLGAPNSTTGSIFRTEDGESWELVSHLGGWRTYDVLHENEQFFALYVDEYRSIEVHLAVSNDAVDWTPVLTETLQPIALREFHGDVLAVSRERETIYRVGADKTVVAHKVPAPVGVSWPYAINRNVWTVADDLLYVIVEQPDGNAAVLRTPDLESWETVLISAEHLLTLTHWPEKEQLIITSRDGGISLLDIGRDALPVALRSQGLQNTPTLASGLLPLIVMLLSAGTLLIYLSDTLEKINRSSVPVRGSRNWDSWDWWD